MARTEEPRLSGELATELRQAIAERFAAKRRGWEWRRAPRGRYVGPTRRALADATDDWVADRTIHRWLKDGTDLTKRAAIELIVRSHAIKMPLPDELIRKVLDDGKTPAILVLPGEGRKLATWVTSIAAHTLGLRGRSKSHLEEQLRTRFERYERYGESPDGRDVLNYIYAKCNENDWEGMTRSRSMLARAGEASVYRGDQKYLTVTSPLGMAKRYLKELKSSGAAHT